MAKVFGKPFQKGQSGNPGGRPNGLAEVQQLARTYTQEAMDALARILKLKKTHPSAVVAAAQAILDRGWGKPKQTIAGDQDNPLKITEIRQVIIDHRQPDETKPA